MAEPLSCEVREALERASLRISGPKDRPYVLQLLTRVVENNAIPADLIDLIPIRAGSAQKTRFDQLYDAAMFLAFPSYRKETLQKLLGPDWEAKSKVKIWRVIFPESFGLSHVL